MSNKNLLSSAFLHAERLQYEIDSYYTNETEFEVPRTVSFVAAAGDSAVEWSMRYRKDADRSNGRLRQILSSGSAALRITERSNYLETVTSSPTMYRHNRWHGSVSEYSESLPRGSVYYQDGARQYLNDQAAADLLGRFIAISPGTILPLTPFEYDHQLSIFDNVPVRRADVDNHDYAAVNATLDAALETDLDVSSEHHLVQFRSIDGGLIQIERGSFPADTSIQITFQYETPDGSNVSATLNGVFAIRYSQRRALWTGTVDRHVPLRSGSTSTTIDYHNEPIDHETLSCLLNYVVDLKADAHKAYVIPKPYQHDNIEKVIPEAQAGRVTSSLRYTLYGV